MITRWMLENVLQLDILFVKLGGDVLTWCQINSVILAIRKMKNNPTFGVAGIVFYDQNNCDTVYVFAGS